MPVPDPHGNLQPLVLQELKITIRQRLLEYQAQTMAHQRLLQGKGTRRAGCAAYQGRVKPAYDANE